MNTKSILLAILVLSSFILPVRRITSAAIGADQVVLESSTRVPRFIPIDPRPVATPTPLPTPTPVPTPSITFSGEYYLLYRPDPKCLPAIQTVTFPTNAKVDCLQDKTKTALLDIVRRYKIDVGHESPCWPFFNESYYNCLDLGMKAPMVAFGLSPHWTKGLRLNVPWEGCANGISGNPIFVNMVDPVNMLKLVSWETANYWLWKHMDRVDLTDGPYVSEVSNRAYLECSMVN